MAGHSIDFDETPAGANVFAAAAGFGLTADEMLKAVAAALDRLPREVQADCIDEFAGAFVTLVIDKERARESAPR
jgi:hypothetical protein